MPISKDLVCFSISIRLAESLTFGKLVFLVRLKLDLILLPGSMLFLYYSSMLCVIMFIGNCFSLLWTVPIPSFSYLTAFYFVALWELSLSCVSKDTSLAIVLFGYSSVCYFTIIWVFSVLSIKLSRSWISLKSSMIPSLLTVICPSTRLSSAGISPYGR